MSCPADLLSFTSAKLPLLPEHSQKNRGKVYDQVSAYTSPPEQDDKGHLIPNFRKNFQAQNSSSQSLCLQNYHFNHQQELKIQDLSIKIMVIQKNYSNSMLVFKVKVVRTQKTYFLWSDFYLFQRKRN